MLNTIHVALTKAQSHQPNHINRSIGALRDWALVRATIHVHFQGRRYVFMLLFVSIVGWKINSVLLKFSFIKTWEGRKRACMNKNTWHREEAFIPTSFLPSLVILRAFPTRATQLSTFFPRSSEEERSEREISKLSNISGEMGPFHSVLTAGKIVISLTRAHANRTNAPTEAEAAMSRRPPG